MKWKETEKVYIDQVEIDTKVNVIYLWWLEFVWEKGEGKKGRKNLTFMPMQINLGSLKYNLKFDITVWCYSSDSTPSSEPLSSY